MAVASVYKAGRLGGLEVALFPRHFLELPLRGFVLPRAREVTFFGHLVTNIVTSCVVGVWMRGWIGNWNQWVKGFECFWYMSCV
jgi:hypothetical protein